MTASASPTANLAPTASLRPSMHGFGALLITLSSLSPTIGVFVVGSDVIRQAGTGVALCFIAAALLGVAMAAVYGELAAAFPETGGEYTILSRALGPAWGVGALAINLLGFSIGQSVAGLGLSTYLAAVAPGLPPAPTAAVLVVLVTGLAVLNIRLNALITGAFLAVELLSLLALAGLGFFHARRPILPMLLHPAVLVGAGHLAPVSLAVLGAATSGAIYAFNGYGGVVFLGEELHEAHSRIAKVVFLALGIAVLTEIGPIVAMLVGAPGLPGFLASNAPISHFIAALGGPLVATVMSLGVALAIFNAMIAVSVMAARQLFSTGRDQLWSPPVNRLVSAVHPRFGSPWGATLVMGTAALVGCFVDQRILVLILGNGNVAVYSGLCIAVMVGRRSGATKHGLFRMPLFPLAPVAALLALGGVVWFGLHDIGGAEGIGATAFVALLGAGYYQFRLRGGGRWTDRGPGAAVGAISEPAKAVESA